MFESLTEAFKKFSIQFCYPRSEPSSPAFRRCTFNIRLALQLQTLLEIFSRAEDEVLDQQHPLPVACGSFLMGGEFTGGVQGRGYAGSLYSLDPQDFGPA